MTQTRSKRELEKRFDAASELEGELKPRYNVAPTQESPVIVEDSGRKLRLLRWGLIPSWAKDEKIGARCLNARAESLEEKPAFRDAFRARRCLVVADGFYEWRRDRTPLWIRPAEGGLFAMAGLWDRWKGPKGEWTSFTIVTTRANAQMAALHDRMPVILSREGEARWLAAKTPAEVLRSLLVPLDAPLALTPVSRLVNSPSNDSPDCVKPEADELPLPLPPADRA